ncbi:hypothetical protein NKR23_g12362 [Pleurostoma richardsiae]|uniref:Transmembrane protein n=1 Tax=Pleurostoma richardsiae TaxID=41990 RepID=A0AA38R853_9PEZI|nr:hypothetical protein NKR23_g12362 [Pleurostoma richardsiae]
MFVTVSANPATVTVTATLGNTVLTVGPSAATASAAPAVMTTDSSQTSSAMISGPGGAFIGGLGTAAGLSVLGMVAITIIRRKRQKKEKQVNKSGFLGSAGLGIKDVLSHNRHRRP